MKKILVLLMVFALISTVAFAGGRRDSDPAFGELPAADVAAQGFNHYSGARGYNELRDSLGPIDVRRLNQPLTIGFTAKALENEFWRMQADGAEAAASELRSKGLNIEVVVAAAQGESDEMGQLAVFNNMVNRRYNAIMVSPISDGNLLSGVENAMREGIPMLVNNDAFMAQIRNTVGAWHLEGAEMAAKWIGDQLGGRGEVGVIMGLPRNEVGRLRGEGVVNYLTRNYPDIDVVGFQNGDWNRTRAKEIADIWLRQFPSIRAIYAANDTMAMGVLEAVREAGRMGQVLVVGCDGVSEALDSIRAGELSATVNNYPFYMSQVGIEMILRSLTGQELPKVIYTPQAVIDRTNITMPDASVINWTGFNIRQ